MSAFAYSDLIFIALAIVALTLPAAFGAWPVIHERFRQWQWMRVQRRVREKLVRQIGAK